MIICSFNSKNSLACGMGFSALVTVEISSWMIPSPHSLIHAFTHFFSHSFWNQLIDSLPFLLRVEERRPLLEDLLPIPLLLLLPLPLVLLHPDLIGELGRLPHRLDLQKRKNYIHILFGFFSIILRMTTEAKKDLRKKAMCLVLMGRPQK